MYKVNFFTLHGNHISLMTAVEIQELNTNPLLHKAWFTYTCDGTGMPVFVADIPAKLSSSQLFRPTADVTEVNRQNSAANIQIIMLWATSPARRRHICEPGLAT